MEIIDEMETTRRGPYAGAVGYIDFAGNMDTCIAIRTMLIKDGKAYVQAGGGVVFDSDPECEYQETVNKARALFRAVETGRERSIGVILVIDNYDFLHVTTSCSISGTGGKAHRASQRCHLAGRDRGDRARKDRHFPRSVYAE